ncbi:MAG: SDR family oxidoreductase [Acidimicrobiia bacterium]|jgi:2-hydroxycyclohexanecarboxyl-CoA dehydrogenase
MRFRGRVAVVTGGASGIGRATVERLAAEGALVAVADLAADGTTEGTGDPLAVPCDVTLPESVTSMIREVERALGPIDVLVNAAGWDRPSRFVDTVPEDWDRVLAVNLRGPIVVTHAVLQGMVGREHGAIVNVASDAGRVGSSGEVVYSAAKGGVIAFTKAVAREVARHGIRVNAVAPGPTDTPFLQAFTGGAETIVEAMVRQTPLRRLAEPADVAAAIAFLASDDARHVTGQTLSVSGGLTMV